MKRSFLFLFPTLFLLLFAGMLFPAFAASPIAAPGGTVRTDEELIEALGGSEAAKCENGAVILMKDIRLTAPIVIAEGGHILQGAGVTLTADFTEGSFITVGDGADSPAGLQLGKSTGSGSAEDLVLDGEGSTFTGSVILVHHGSELILFHGVTVTDITSTACGGAIYNEGTFVMQAGCLKGCRAVGSGGALFSKGTCNLLAGSVENCSAEYGGGLYNEGKMTLAGTGISDCTGQKGGTVFNSGTLSLVSSSVSGSSGILGGCLFNSGDAVLVGGQIVSSAASEAGGAVYNTGTLTLSGTYVNQSSAPEGGSVYNLGSVTLTDGYICQAEASVRGGNFFNAPEASMLLEGGSVSEGKAPLGGGIYNEGTLSVTGGGFSLNKADLGQAIFNAGTLIFEKYPYIDKKNDVFLLSDGTDGSLLCIRSELKADTVAVLTPGIPTADGYTVSYTEGAPLFRYEGEDFPRNAEEHLTLSDADGWTLDGEGRLRKVTRRSPYIPVLIGSLIAFPVTVALLVLGIRFSDRKKKSSAG